MEMIEVIGETAVLEVSIPKIGKIAVIEISAQHTGRLPLIDGVGDFLGVGIISHELRFEEAPEKGEADDGIAILSG